MTMDFFIRLDKEGNSYRKNLLLLLMYEKDDATLCNTCHD
jgi:hypothetical protein